MHEDLHFDHDGIDLVKMAEGCKLTAYQCPAGIWTIGYGSTGGDVVEGLSITAAQAEARLLHDVRHAEDCVKAFVKVEINQHQYDALVDFCFNVGGGNFAQSTLLKKVNANKFDEVEQEFLRWDKAGGRVLKGLHDRRVKEAELFNEKEDGHTNAD